MTPTRIFLLSLSLMASLAATDCGGGGGGGQAAAPQNGAGSQTTARTAQLVLEGLPTGAKVYVDGAPQPAGATTLALNVGDHEIVIARAGYQWANAEEFKKVNVSVGQTLTKKAVFTRRKPPKLTVPGLLP